MNNGRIDLLARGIAVRHPGPDQSDDGPDFQYFCTLHQWASLPLPTAVPDRCPFCCVHREEGLSLERYLDLQQALLTQELERVGSCRAFHGFVPDRRPDWPA